MADGSGDTGVGSTLPAVGSTVDDGGVNRRDALKTMAVAASLPILGSLPIHEADAQGQPATASAPARPASLLSGPRGTPSDPDLLRPKKDWKRKLLASELVTL